ncbi:S-layer homology domain-containing protein [Acetivibrio cellulolyticus]|uniref:S-layer homology domain-containing protein n=1 Tax=Acetivibrio cellulolyticus TaxID=35830 RepID=UPI0001E2F0B0|nr:S-layer homology domain-containing protein [Acetivibrio cellulolyticus]
MKKAVNIIIVFTMLIILITNTSASSNVSVMEQNANSIVKLGIMKGYEDGSLKLDNKIKRSEFITLIVKMMAYDKDTNLDSININFTDLKKKHWAYTNISLALKYKLVTGYPDNTIAPDKDVTYAEALAVVIRALGYEKTLTGKWPNNVVNKGIELGLNKNLSLDANHQLTRGEMSVIVYNALTVNFATN